MSALHRDFGGVLVRRQVLTMSQLNEARRIEWKAKRNLGEVLVALGYASPQEIEEARAEFDGRRLLDLSRLQVARAILEHVSETLARAYTVLPFGFDAQGRLQLACAYPIDADQVQQLEFKLRRKLAPVPAWRTQIIEAINRLYKTPSSDGDSVDSMLQEFTDTAIDFTSTPADDGKDIFECDPSIPPLEDDESEAVALEEVDSDLESSGFGFASVEASTGEGQATDGEDSEFELTLDDSSDRLLANTKVRCEELPPAAGATLDAPRMRCAASASLACFKQGLLGVEDKVAEKQAAIRYYHQMNPERMFPLVVQISSRTLRRVLGQQVRQEVSKRFQVDMAADIDIEPVLPGCYCYPPRVQLKPDRHDVETTFWVVPHVLGKLMGPRVILRQGDRVLAEVPLEIHVVKQNVTLFVAALSFLLPFFSVFRSYDEASGRGWIRQWLDWLLNSVTPELLMVGLVGTTVALYCWLRPKSMSVTCDLEPAENNARPVVSRPVTVP